MDDLVKQAREALDGVTEGPWSVCDYDAGDCSWYDHNGPCPSIQAPDDQDCAIVHWDGFKQQYWSACNGNQRQIEANARFIAAARTLVPAMADRIEALIIDRTMARAALDEAVELIGNEVNRSRRHLAAATLAFHDRHQRIHAVRYVPADDDDRLTCDRCKTEAQELRAMPGEFAEQLCEGCCKDVAPGLDFNKLELVQEARG